MPTNLSTEIWLPETAWWLRTSLLKLEVSQVITMPATSPWLLSVEVTWPALTSKCLDFSECLKELSLNVDWQREEVGGGGKDELSGASSPTQKEQYLVAFPTSVFIFLFRFWHDQRYLWDRLLQKRRERPAACPLDVSRVAERWRVYYNVWCLVWEQIPMLHMVTILHYTCTSTLWSPNYNNTQITLWPMFLTAFLT